MHRTKNELDPKTRTEMIQILSDRLAESIDLLYHAKQAHWNVKGPSFIALHKLFDEVAEHFDEFSDLLAERVAQLGGMVKGTIQAAAEGSSLPEYPLELVSGKDHVDQLSTSLAQFSKKLRESIGEADEKDDPTTADVFTEISRGVDKDLWFVESHLSTKEDAAGFWPKRVTKKTASEERAT